MNSVEKLIAGGLEQSEAGRIAALLEEQTDPETEETTSEAPEAGEPEKSGEMSGAEAPNAPETPQSGGSGSAAPAQATGRAGRASEGSSATAINAPETPQSGGSGSAVLGTKGSAPAGRASKTLRSATAINAPDVSALIANLMSAEIRGCALECGVDARRMPALIRLVDTAAIDPAAKNLHEQVLAAVKSALKEVPELVRGGTASGSLGNHARVLTGADDVAAKFRSGF